MAESKADRKYWILGRQKKLVVKFFPKVAKKNLYSKHDTSLMTAHVIVILS